MKLVNDANVVFARSQRIPHRLLMLLMVLSMKSSDLEQRKNGYKYANKNFDRLKCKKLY